MSATCTSCGAAIIWAVSRNGVPTPINAEPDPGGNVDLQPAADPREAPTAHVLGPRRIPDGMQPRGFVRHTSHFVTCPAAALHRNPRGRA